MQIVKRINTFSLHTFGRLNTRLRCVISTLIMMVVMLISTFFLFEDTWYVLPILIFFSYLLTYFAVLEGIEKREWLMLFLMPVFLTFAFYLFYFLFPVRWITRLPFIIIYGFSTYALLLTSNIFNVGVEKSLQLYRAAFSINYFFQILIMFLLMNVLFSFKQNFFINGLGAFIIALCIAFQFLWTVHLKLEGDREVVKYTLLIAFVIMQLAILFSFIAILQTILALFLTACFYCLCGLIYHYMDERLFQQTIREYVFVFAFVALILLLSLY